MSERFIIKQAADMVAGEPCTSSGIPHRWTLEQAEDRVRGWCADLNSGRGPDHLNWEAWNTRPLGFVPLWGIVDTHDAWHTARVKAPPLELTAEDVDPWRDRRKARAHHRNQHRWNHDPVKDAYHCLCGVRARHPPVGLTEKACEIAWLMYADRATPKAPSGPTDAEIVAVMESWQRHETPLAYTNCVATFVVAGYERPVTMMEARAAWSRELKRKQAEAREVERHRVICEDQYEL